MVTHFSLSIFNLRRDYTTLFDQSGLCPIEGLRWEVVCQRIEEDGMASSLSTHVTPFVFPAYWTKLSRHLNPAVGVGWLRLPYPPLNPRQSSTSVAVAQIAAGVPNARRQERQMNTFGLTGLGER